MGENGCRESQTSRHHQNHQKQIVSTGSIPDSLISIQEKRLLFNQGRHNEISLPGLMHHPGYSLKRFIDNSVEN